MNEPLGKATILFNEPLGMSYSFGDSLAFQNLTSTPCEDVQKRVLSQELSFIYSTQYLAEQNGEAALEHIREYTYKKSVQNKILDMQLKDEISHVQLLNPIVEYIGLDQSANQFAEGYSKILHSVGTLSEKIFVFQIMTEAVSTAYLKWRLKKVESIRANEVDEEILSDEIRHLKMGKSLLSMCDIEELKDSLNLNRRRALIREMKDMCTVHFSEGIAKIFKENKLENEFQRKITDLDQIVGRSILAETKAANAFIEGSPV
jgi:uncharacterized ferritin-like protein (DUF455 family)